MKKINILILFYLFFLINAIKREQPRELIPGIYNIGVNDPKIDLFEGQYPVPDGMAYNSYLVLDGEESVIFDTVDKAFLNEWLKNIDDILKGKQPKYLIIQHMEPDHSANIADFTKRYPKTQIVSSIKAFNMMTNYFHTAYEDKRIVVQEGDQINFGKHSFIFVEAPMVHWPEVILTYDSTTKTLFSVDAFGKFGVNNKEGSDNINNWDDEARRYYIGIVGKYGKPVQKLLKKASTLDIQMICPTHGPVLKENLGHYINLYKIWSSYDFEEDGIVIAYTSVYGHTKEAVENIAEKLRIKGAPKVVVYDLARIDVSYVVSDIFRYSKVIFATTTYNAGIFPPMRNLLLHLVERNFQKKTVAFIENGSWGIEAKNVMMKLLENSNITYTKNFVSIKSAMNEENEKQIDKLVEELTEVYQKQNEKNTLMDMSALFNIGYGLYVITSNDGQKDNGFICNSVVQLTSTPTKIGVTINKDNYSHSTILEKKIMNLNILNTETPFSVFEHFGFQSGRTVNKFENYPFKRSTNGLPFLTKYINSVISLKVLQYIDLGTHGMFICEVTESRVFNRIETLTYSRYQSCVKPRPDADSGYVCKVCGFVYEGENLPNDYICPLCKHCAVDFTKIEN